MAKIFFDFDGVLVRSRCPDKTFLWQKEIERELKLPSTTMSILFQQPEWNEIISGRADFRRKIEEVFRQSSFSATADEFISYWLSRDLNWRYDILNLASDLKNAGHSLFIATNQDKIRLDYIGKQNEIIGLFLKIFSSCDLGITKPNPDFYQRIHDQNFSKQKEDFFIIDDDRRNIEAANSVGWSGLYFNPDLDDAHSVESLKSALAKAFQ
jgi:putative hydrolase of the HAD superfamily